MKIVLVSPPTVGLTGFRAGDYKYHNASLHFWSRKTWLPPVFRRYFYLQFVYVYIHPLKESVTESEAIAAFINISSR